LKRAGAIFEKSKIIDDFEKKSRKKDQNRMTNPALVCFEPLWELWELQSWFEYMQRLQITLRIVFWLRPKFVNEKAEGVVGTQTLGILVGLVAGWSTYL